jgi:hypothetical protein
MGDDGSSVSDLSGRESIVDTFDKCIEGKMGNTVSGLQR